MGEAYEVGISVDGTYVYVRDFRKKISLDIALSFTRDYVTLGKASGVLRCLIDARGTSSISGASGKYDYAYKKSEAVGLTRDWRIALIRDAGNTSYDFLEVVMHNTARSLKLFEDESEALAWLMDG